MDTIRDRVLSGDLQLWSADDELFCLTELIVSPTGNVKVLNFFALGGTNLPKHYREGAKVIEAWGREMGCNRARIEGRRGWRRISMYEPKWVFLEKDL